MLQAKIHDGSKIQNVKAKLISKDEPAKSFDVELKDDGIAGDQADGDNVFSKKISEQKFGFYRVVIEAIDSFGNKLIEEAPEESLLH
jgi:hypothetical protein